MIACRHHHRMIDRSRHVARGVSHAAALAVGISKPREHALVLRRHHRVILYNYSRRRRKLERAIEETSFESWTCSVTRTNRIVLVATRRIGSRSHDAHGRVAFLLLIFFMPHPVKPPEKVGVELLGPKSESRPETRPLSDNQ